MNDKEFNEFELLTLRECLFRCKADENLMSDDEFKQIDDKIRLKVKVLK